MSSNLKYDLQARAAGLGKRCRHHDPRAGITCGADCKIGHPIREIVAKAAGSDVGIAFMLPCHPGPERKAECPDYDPKTPEELAAERAAFDAHVDRTIKLIKAAGEWRRKMVENGLTAATATCPNCGMKDGVALTCALGVNNHLWAKCRGCGAGFIE